MEKKENIELEEEKIIHPLDEKKQGRFSKYTNLIAVLLVLTLGVGSGFVVSQLTVATGIADKRIDVKELSSDDEIKKGLVVGVDDKKQFPDSAEGKLVEGGIDGEGTHHLERPGGESQNVYLTSSNVDLDKFVGHEVKVDGKTFDAEKAGWLMDVGQLKLLK